MTRVTKKE